MRSLLVLLSLNFCLFTTISLPSSPESQWKPLFNGKDLSGWEVVGGGDWTVEEEQIVVRRKPDESSAGWLVSLHNYEDFKLRFQFKSEYEHFNSGILLRDPGHAKIGRPAFNGYEVQIYQGAEESERNTTGAIYDLARAFPAKLPVNTWADFEIHCIGNHIVTFLNGEKMAETHNRRSYKGAIGLQLHGGREKTEFRWRNLQIAQLPTAPRPFQLMEEELEQAPGEFVPFLEGKKLEDFDVYWEGGADWELSQDVLRGESPQEISWIFAPGEYSDFVLAFDYRISPGGNAGIAIRFPWKGGGQKKKGPAFLGYECQIADTGEVNSTGSIYNLARAYTSDLRHRPIQRAGDWNHYRIYARGNHIVTYVNRRKMAETHVDRSFKGRIGFQVHEPAQWVEYRNIQIKVVQD